MAIISRNYSLYLLQLCTHFYITMPSCRTLGTHVRYLDDEALKEAVKEWMEGQTKDFYFSGISLSEKCHKCIKLSRDCVEKQSVVCNISVLIYGQVAKLFKRPSYVQI